MKTWTQTPRNTHSSSLVALLLVLASFATACNSAFLQNIKPLIAEATCSVVQTSAVRLARDIAASDVRSYPFWRNGAPIPLQEQRDFCVARIQAEKYFILEKPWVGEDHFTTTVPLPQLSKIPGIENVPGIDTLPSDVLGVVLTRKGLNDDTLIKQTATYCHELVHVYTEKRLGLINSGVAFAIPATRAGFEFPAYGVTLAVYYLNGAPMDQIERKAENTIDTLDESYLLQSLPEGCLHEMAVSYWQGSKWLAPATIRSDLAIKGTYE